MRVKSRVWTLVLALTICVAGHLVANAATWKVEKDGSGEFMIIQDAIDAAAPGDTILIGPGRFDTFRPDNSTVDNFAFAAIAWIKTADLTITGAGTDQTFLGTDTPTAEAEGLPAGSLYFDGGSAGSRISGVQLDNTQGIVTIRDQSIIEDCRVVRVPLGSTFAITVLDAPDVIIRTSEFIGADNILTGFGTARCIVEDCTFEDQSQLGIAVAIGNAAQDCVVRRCTMTIGGGGVQFGLGATGIVEDCEILGMEGAGIDVSQGSAVVRKCRLGATRQTLRMNLGSVEVYDSLLEGGTQATVVTWGNVLIRGSHLLNSEGAPTIRNRATTGELVDVRHNWWGTTDTVQIESWVDDPNGTAIWSPIADMPIPTEDRSMSEFKGRHRN